MKSRNIFSRLPAAGKQEAFETLAKGKGFKIERIVSRGQATPGGKWLCSKAAEWVIVLRGSARILFKGSLEKSHLKAGDYVFIPAGTHHRVEWTHPKQKTVWLAVHVGPVRDIKK
ncbi:MAG: cupin domain-containing protein [Candidatus Omnitrophica bacterium]|nr:cupin domain-containing protein [Candidatus Omnitrophota bacterium]